MSESNLISCGIESLIKLKDELYIKYHEKDSAIAKNVAEAVGKQSDAYRWSNAVAQGLFDSGFLSLEASDYGTDKLLELIFAMKIKHHLPMFEKLHTVLTENNFTDHRAWNTKLNVGGDNYVSARTFTRSEDAKSWEKTFYKTGEVKVITTKVLILECQSPTYAVVAEYSPYDTQHIDKAFLVRLKRNYDNKDRIEELFNLVESNQLDLEWSPCPLTSRDFGIITQYRAHDMQCRNVSDPKGIEMVLSNLTVARVIDDILEETKQRFTRSEDIEN